MLQQQLRLKRLYLKASVCFALQHALQLGLQQRALALNSDASVSICAFVPVKLAS
jgi:hypothetical protein